MNYKTVLKILRILAGIVFLLSGLLKGVDPEGSAIKFTEYFEVAGLAIPWALALIFAIALIAIEFMTGMSLVTGIKVNWAKYAFLGFMLIFTPVTLILALTNPVSDCGCFGDAIKLTNWQTFYKNIPLLLISVALVLRKEDKGSSNKKLSTLAIAFVLIIIFQAYNIMYLPLIDFRPYHVGADLRMKLTIPKDAEGDKYETLFIYAKDGVEKEFTLENYPAGDTTWTFVDQKSKLVSRGYIPEIGGFSLTSSSEGEITNRILEDENEIFLMIVFNIDKANEKGIRKGLRLKEEVEANGSRLYLVTASPETVVLNSRVSF